MSEDIDRTEGLSGIGTHLKVFEKRENSEYVIDLEAQRSILILQNIDRARGGSVGSLLFS